MRQTERRSRGGELGSNYKGLRLSSNLDLDHNCIGLSMLFSVLDVESLETPNGERIAF